MINDFIKKHYLEVSAYTYAGAYKDYFQSLPDDIPTLGRLVCGQVIHPSFFFTPVSKYMEDKYFGKLSSFQKHRFLNEDELFVTAAAMTAELFRLDERGFVEDKDVTGRLSVSCRQASVLMTAILKAKNIPCRSRAGFIDFGDDSSSYIEHWVNEYWNDNEQRWVLMDIDGYYEFESRFGYSQFDLPVRKFISGADAWLRIRCGTLDKTKIIIDEAEPGQGIYSYMMMDFHSLMNNEIFYSFLPKHFYNNYAKITEDELCGLDDLARLAKNPDDNFNELYEIWNNNEKYYSLSNFGTDLYYKIFAPK
ncbi:hypothetical protein HNQ56_001728 [Anaerotaenia torta]|uniref:transglutaminase-like domain-containing protein n=1 Tax=Anaerotaenia torta TaxID=433293 RepID=UPI003D21C67A